MKNLVFNLRTAKAQAEGCAKVTKSSRMAKILTTLTILLTLGFGQMWAGTSTTLYFCPGICGKNWTTPYVNVCTMWNSNTDNHWSNLAMSEVSGKTIDGYKVYSVTFTDEYNGARTIEFHASQNNYTSSLKPVNASWTGVGTYNGKLCNSAGNGWIEYQTDHKIANGATVVWDLANDDWGNNAYLRRAHYVATADHDALSKLANNQFYKDYTSNVYCESFLFRNRNDGTWPDYKQTTDITGSNCDISSGITLFTYPNTVSGTKLNWQKTSPAYKAASGQTVYFDNTATGWAQPKFKYGTQWFNRYVDMTQVPGTANLWKYTMPHDLYYGKYKIADEFGWTDYNNIDDDHCAHYTVSQAASITSAKTVIPSTNGAPCTTSILDGYTRSVTITAPSNGTITVTYTDIDNSSKEKTSGSFNVAQTCIITVTASPSSGYVLSSLTVGGNAFTSGNTYTVRANTTISASFVAETTHDVDVSYICTDTGADVKSGSTTAVGETTASTFEAGTPNGFSFTRWVVGSGLTITAGSTSTNSISVKTKASGTYTLRAEYTEVLTTSWYISGATGGGSPFAGTGTSGTRMSKKSGHSAEEIYYCTISVSTTATGSGYSFNPYNSSESKNYGNASANITKANNSADVYGDNSTALHFLPYVTGSYEFKLDNTGAHPVLTVTWPVYNQLRVSAASPTDATNTGNFDLADKGSNNWSVKRTLNAKTTYTFKMMFDSEWYGNSGNFTRASNSATNIGNTGNMTVKTDVAGEYTFTFNSSSHNFSITYPDAFTVEFGSNGHSTVTASATSAGGSFSSGAYVKSGDVVTFSESHDDGYRLKGWYTTVDGNTSAGLNGDNELTINANKTVYAQFLENMSTITVSAGTGGTVTTGAGEHSLGVTTTQAINASANNGYSWSTWTLTGNARLVSSATTKSNTAKTDGTNNGTGTIVATFTPNQYDIILDVNGGSGANQTVRATFAAAMPTTLKGGGAIAARSRTGYNFDGYTKNNDGTGTKYYTSALASNANLDIYTNNTHIYAKWNAKQSAITFDYQTGVTGYGSSGDITNATGLKGTYDADMTALTGTMPSAANGYAFMGFYDAVSGGGTKYYNADGTSAHVWDKDKETGTTLYAYWKKAEITGITFSPAAAEPGDEVTATAAISPTPSGTTTVCWEVRYASNDVPLDPQPTLTPSSGTSVSFTAPPAAVYKFIATLKTGNECSGGTVLDTENANLTVAGSHPVTIRYKHGDVVIKEETIQNIHATVATEISAPNIIGYSFSSWTLGDGITKVSGNLTDPSITVTAIYDGVITANYNTKRMIYFYNTLGWSGVNVYFYKNASYWNASNGTGSSHTDTYTSTPFSESKYGAMTRIEGTNIWYFDAEDAGVNASYEDVVFTEYLQYDYHFFSYKSGTTTPNKVTRRGDYKSSMPMFVPVEQDGVSMNGGQALYYNEGYWMNYPENTGYTVRIYNAWNDDKTSPAREYYFPYSSDKKMPLKLDVEFNTTDAKWFMIYRNDGVYLGVNAVMTQASHTNYRIKDSNDKIKIQPSAPGIYTYTLTFYDDGEKDGSGKAYGNMYHITVDYPVSVGDYRIMYSDNAKWSQGWAHNSAGHTWCHPSDAVNKISGEATEAKKDTVSLFVSYGASPTAKFQYVSAINPSTGAVTWTDVAGGTINLSSITKSGTYNFIISQPVGGASVSVEKIEAYTGNYYIRTDCAGNTKWDSYRAADHQMTYSEFSCSEANSFGEKFSHYFAHWCPAGMNVKFVIANDYSSCISDTLIQDVGNTYANINSDGFLNSDGNPEETANRFSANIRFMYNEATNKISRAYVASSTNSARWFLVLRSNTEIQDEGGDAMENIGTGIPSVILNDKQNWIYEQTLKILPSSRFKLFACYADVTPTEARAQYFRGNYATDSWADANTIELVGGDPASGYQLVRVLYDFKTNRLVCAWLPSGDISSEIDINADVMIIREHQEDATMITFTNSNAKLTDVKTVYGTMKFNRWTLNNKSSSAGHAVLPVDDQKSIFERSLYFISFPFDVNLGEVFGFGTYGVHWIIENYDGENRAKNGYWTDSPPNWKYVTSPKGYTLKANKGYILALDLDLMKDDNEVFWPHGIETVELFFPSAVAQSTIEQENVTIPAPDPAIYQCTINRPGPDGDRRIKDSYWRCLGVPSFANYTTTLSDGTSTITWQTGSTLPYLYAWNMENNKLVAQSTSTFAFKTMHAYLTQCSTAIIWSAASKPSPSPIVARRSDNEMLKDREFRLELAENDIVADQAFVRLSAKEDVSAEFEFGNDLSKELNSGASNIYTLIGYERAAANSLPLSTEQTTIIPVGVLANTAGDYTFSIPDGTDGIGVTLIDNETGIHTQLGALDYTVTLDKGTYESRFYLEISPIAQTPTGVETVTGEGLPVTGAQKVLIDGILYIVKDGKLFDARGTRVE